MAYAQYPGQELALIVVSTGFNRIHGFYMLQKTANDIIIFHSQGFLETSD